MSEVTFSLRRQFALFGAVLFLLGAIGLWYAQYHMAIAQLKAMTEQENTTLTDAIANALSQPIHEYLNETATIPPPDLGRHPALPKLRTAILDISANSHAVKFKLYNDRGITIFSTDPKQIGEDKAGNPGFRIALGGGVSSDITFRDTFDAFDGVLVDRDLVFSYVPLRLHGAMGLASGVVEVYSDVTAFKRRALDNMITTGALSGVAMGGLYALLLLTVHRGSRALAAQHAMNLKLAASAARADADSRDKSRFLATISHELRTPLNAVIGFSELMLTEPNGPIGSPRYTEYLSDIKMAGDNLLTIINEILDLTEIESGAVAVTATPVNLKPVLEEATRQMRSVAERNGIAMALVVASDLPKVQSDAKRIGQILFNLISNAIKFSASGGQVVVSAETDRQRTQVCISVADKGIGISAEDIATCLTPFGQVEDTLKRSRGGIGLGLTLTKRFVELMGGSIAITSDLGKGTTVTVTLPAAGETPRLRLVSDAA